VPRETDVKISEAWKTIFPSIAVGCAGIVRYATAQGISPSDFSDEHLNAWGQMMLAEQHSFNHVRECKRLFRHALIQSGLAQMLPGISHRRVCNYGIPLRDFPERLRDEVIALLDWKQAPYSAPPA
jgi:hypothetical protein